MLIDGADVTAARPQDRGIGFVFQHYAAFAHMTVRDNVAFGLKIRKRPKAEVKSRVDELLAQLGLAAPQGAKPEVDLIGARQTIDTLAMLQQKTKGNLTAAEENMMQNCLYELRMAYLEVTNLITHPPQGGRR